jgi:hypothetical protein
MNGNGTYSISGAYGDNVYTHYHNLHLHNCGTNSIVEVDTGSVINCEVETNSGSYKYGIYSRGFSHVLNNNVHDVNIALAPYNDNTVAWNYAWNIAGSYAVYNQLYSNDVSNNIISVSGSTSGIYCYERGLIANNSILSAGGTGYGILIRNAQYNRVVINNLIEGFSGAGGLGITVDDHANSYAQCLIDGNAVYNCATPYDLSLADAVYAAVDNETLTASPFAKKGSTCFEYFRPLNVGNVVRGGYPADSRMFKGAVPPKIAVVMPQIIQAGIGVL